MTHQPRACRRCGSTYTPTNGNQRYCPACRAAPGEALARPGVQAMTTKADRLRKVAPGAGDDILGVLAALPADQVAAITRFARQARRDERRYQAELRRQEKPHRKKKYNEDGNHQVADYADQLFMRSIVPRAGLRLDALARLKQHYDDGPAVLALAVAGARAKGFSDTDIGMALGHDKPFARQAVWARFGKRNPAGACSDDHYTGPGCTDESAS